MSRVKNDGSIVDADERALVVAYLSYALDDVRALSANGLHLLQMTIAAIAAESVAENSGSESPIVSCH